MCAQGKSEVSVGALGKAGVGGLHACELISCQLKWVQD